MSVRGEGLYGPEIFQGAGMRRQSALGYQTELRGVSKESNAVLQLSIAQNERVKRRQLVAFGVLVVALAAILLWGAAASPGNRLQICRN